MWYCVDCTTPILAQSPRRETSGRSPTTFSCRRRRSQQHARVYDELRLIRRHDEPTVDAVTSTRSRTSSRADDGILVGAIVYVGGCELDHAGFQRAGAAAVLESETTLDRALDRTVRNAVAVESTRPVSRPGSKLKLVAAARRLVHGNWESIASGTVLGSGSEFVHGRRRRCRRHPVLLASRKESFAATRSRPQLRSAEPPGPLLQRSEHGCDFTDINFAAGGRSAAADDRPATRGRNQGARTRSFARSGRGFWLREAGEIDQCLLILRNDDDTPVAARSAGKDHLQRLRFVVTSICFTSDAEFLTKHCDSSRSLSQEPSPAKVFGPDVVGRNFLARLDWWRWSTRLVRNFQYPSTRHCLHRQRFVALDAVGRCCGSAPAGSRCRKLQRARTRDSARTWFASSRDYFSQRNTRRPSRVT